MLQLVLTISSQFELYSNGDFVPKVVGNCPNINGCLDAIAAIGPAIKSTAVCP
jgi:hypothetical protein